MKNFLFKFLSPLIAFSMVLFAFTSFSISYADAPAYSISINTPVDINGSIVTIDGNASATKFAGQLSQYNVTVLDWGDGLSTPLLPGDFSLIESGKDFSGTWGPVSHTYSTTGIFTVTVKLHHQNENGNESSDATAQTDVTVTPVDICPNVTGVQTTGPCADALCLAPNTWNIANQTCDAPVDICPNVTGVQTTGPCADALCLAPNTWNIANQTCDAPVDICPYVTGVQTTGPCADALCLAPNTWNIANQTCDAPNPIDICPNVTGMQTEGPCADTLCLAPNTWNVENQTCDAPNPVDICPNVTGMQTEGPCADALCLAPNTWNIVNQTCDKPAPIVCTEGQELIDDVCVTPQEKPTRSHSSSTGGSVPQNFSPIGQVLGAETSCGIYVDKFLHKGYKNDTGAVIKLQNFLNNHMNAGLPVNGNYGSMTEKAVRAFQEKYASDVLSPWGIKETTGIFYLTTQRQVNNIMCPDLNLPVPELIPFNRNPLAPAK